MERKKAIITGIVGIITILIFIWGLNFLKGRNILKKEKIFYATFEHLGGLTVGSPVMFKGYSVGQVKNIKFNDVYGTKLIVIFNIEKNIKIPKGSTVEIFNADLLGTKALRVIMTKSNEYHNSGDTINSKIVPGIFEEVTKQIEPLKQKTEKLMTSIDSITNVLNTILAENKNSINSSLTSISIITKNFEYLSASLNDMVNKDDGKLNLIISDLQSITNMLKENEPELNNAILNFSNISDSIANANIAQTIKQTNIVLENFKNITEKINNGEGSMGQLLNNDSLYYNIENLSENLNLLIEDLKKNPKKYLNLSIIDLSKTNNKIN